MDANAICTKCHSTAPTGAVFCPFCGAALAEAAVSAEEQAELDRIAAEGDPAKKHELIEAALAAYPNSLALLAEKLYLGRLYERGRRSADFSIIKCYLLHIYHAPQELAPEARADMRRELLHDPLLMRCCALAPDVRAFMNEYLTRLVGEYVSLFLLGDSRIMRSVMGFRIDSNPAKRLARPVALMILRVRADGDITPDERDMLVGALRAAYAAQAGGETRLLDEALQKE